MAIGLVHAHRAAEQHERVGVERGGDRLAAERRDNRERVTARRGERDQRARVFAGDVLDDEDAAHRSSLRNTPARVQAARDDRRRFGPVRQSPSSRHCPHLPRAPQLPSATVVVDASQGELVGPGPGVDAGVRREHRPRGIGEYTAKVDDIRMCVTSEQDLSVWFGEPYQRGNQSGFPTLQWGYAHAGPGGGESQSLTVYLNADRKVVDFQLNPAGPLPAMTDRCARPPAATP